MSHSPPPPAGELPQRRSFLTWLTVLAGAVATVFMAIPVVGYLLGPLKKRREIWVSIGKLADFPPNQTRAASFVNQLQQPWDGMTANNTVYVRNLGDAGAQPSLQVFAANCAHLGCPVTWFPQSGLFMCPCHGGVYYEDGERASGPPPRGLFQCEFRIKDGEVQIQSPHMPTLQDPLNKKDRV